jgi:hypothetical protein
LHISNIRIVIVRIASTNWLVKKSISPPISDQGEKLLALNRISLCYDFLKILNWRRVLCHKGWVAHFIALQRSGKSYMQYVPKVMVRFQMTRWNTMDIMTFGVKAIPVTGHGGCRGVRCRGSHIF